MAKGKQENRILILGGYGFVGKNLASALQKTKHKIYTASRADGVDLADFEITKKYLSEISPDIIFNCAAHVGSVHYVTNNAARVISDNIQMALNLYKAASLSCPQTKIINPLSNCSYPGGNSVQIESEWWEGQVHDSVYAYGNAKKFLYVLSKCYEKQYSIKTGNFLVPNTFGPGDSADPNKTHALNGMIIRMIDAQKKSSDKFEIWGTGNPIREWAYIDDVVNIMVQSLDMDENFIEPVNIAQNKGYTIKESAGFILKALNFKGKLVFNTEYQDGDPKKILDDKRFRKFFPNFVFFDHQKGIENTVNYYKQIL